MGQAGMGRYACLMAGFGEIRSGYVDVPMEGSGVRADDRGDDRAVVAG